MAYIGISDNWPFQYRGCSSAKYFVQRHLGELILARYFFQYWLIQWLSG